jgi:hypothetical protein
MRWALVEMAWRLVRYQPNCYAVRGWGEVIREHPKDKLKRKKAIVAVARQLAVDLWRVATGQTTFEKLGFVMPPPKPMAARARAA